MMESSFCDWSSDVCSSDLVEMLIKDNGKGIRNEFVNSLKSMGIAGMKERVNSVSGKITFRGEKGSGTRIKIFIPLKRSGV
jgi:signal transduction histidine kinase